MNGVSLGEAMQSGGSCCDAEACRPAVSIVVVNWNGREKIEPCLASIIEQTFSDFEVIVVDNGSTDGSRELLRRIPDVRLIELDRNLGFGPANNIAFKSAKGKFVATVNSDIRLAGDWLDILVRAINTDSQCFAVQGRNIKEGAAQEIDGCGIGLRACGAARRLCRGRAAAEITGRREIFATSSGAALYRKRMLTELGLFDESYFAYYEDLDVGWRARLKGWRSFLITDAVAWHRVHGTSARLDPQDLWFFGERNRLRTIIKNLPASAACRCLPRIAADELLYVWSIHKQVRWRTMVRARLAVLGELPSLYRKRPIELRKIGCHEWVAWLALTADA